MISRHLNRYFSHFAMICIMQQSTFANESQFDSGFLFGNNSNLDLKNFNKNDYVYPGAYVLDVYLNDKFIVNALVYVSNNKNDPEKQDYCLPSKIVRSLDFKNDVVDNSIVTNTECINLSELNKDISQQIDVANQKINIHSPQVLLSIRPKGYISPELWDNGVTSGFLRYNYNYYKSDMSDSPSNESDYLSLYAGFNIGGWKYSHSGAISQTQENGRYEGYENKLSTTIPQFKSQLIIGDLYSSPLSLFNTNLSLRGLVLETEEQMLPSSMRNYAPVISGFANTNALVRVRQDDFVIFEQSVPAGAFSIADMNTPSARGTLYVDIVEATGEIRTFEIPYNATIRSLRPKQYRYQIALGKYRQFEKSYDENIANVILEYGLNNYLTVRSGGLISDHFQSYALGTSINTFLGGISLEANRINADLPGNLDSVESSFLSINYGWLLSASGLNVNWGHNHYLDENYFSFDDVMKMHYLQEKNDNSYYILNGQPKSYSYFQLGKSLGATRGNINFNYSIGRYWDKRKQQSYRLHYNNTLGRNITYTLGIQYTNINKNQSDTEFYFSLSVPLDIAKNSVNLSYSGVHNTEKNTSNKHRVGVSGGFGEFNQYTYALNMNHQNKENTLGASFNYRATPFLLSTTYSTNFDDRQQYSTQIQGAVVAHKYGLTLNNDLSETFAIVHAKGLKGVSLFNGQNLKFDRWGNAIVPYLTPYQFNSIQINANTLPLAIDVDATEVQFVPSKYASVLAKFKSTNQTKALIQLKHANEKISLGAEVEHNLIGEKNYVGQGQLVFLRNVQQGVYSVTWGSQKCQFDILPEMLDKEQKPFIDLTLTCE